MIDFGCIDKKLLSKFKKYHTDYPEIYEQFKKFVIEISNSGRIKYSAWTIINIIRWNYDLQNEEPFKINNDFIALYARLFVYHYPEYDGFFEFRTMKSFDRRESSEERYRKENKNEYKSTS